MKKSNMIVSIIVPVYNVSNKIDRLMTSLISQNYKNLEIILVDNNSTDNSLNILKEYQKKDKRIKVLTESNQGPNYARKKGFINSHGEYVYFIDADDFLEKDAINNFVKCIEKTKAEIVIGDYNELDSDYNFIRLIKNKLNENENLKSNKTIFLKKPALWNKIFKRDLLDEKEFIFTSIGEDMCITLLCLAKAKHIRYMPTVVYNYAVNSSGLSYIVSYKKMNEIFMTLSSLKKMFIKNNLYDDYKNEIDYIMITHSMYRCFEGELLDKTERISLRNKAILFLDSIDYENNIYYKKSKIYKAVNILIRSKFLYNSYLIRIIIISLFKNNTLNKMLKKLDN